MLVKTKSMGNVEVDNAHIITIPEGLFGFEEYTQYALIDSEYKPFIWLQSTQSATLAFLVVDPFIICSDYEVDIDDSELAKIGIVSPAEVYVLALITIPQDGSAVTANLQGPLVINRTNNKAMQAILSDNRWTTKHSIIESIKQRSK